MSPPGRVSSHTLLCSGASPWQPPPPSRGRPLACPFVQARAGAKPGGKRPLRSPRARTVPRCLPGSEHRKTRQRVSLSQTPHASGSEQLPARCVSEEEAPSASRRSRAPACGAQSARALPALRLVAALGLETARAAVRAEGAGSVTVPGGALGTLSSGSPACPAALLASFVARS